MKATSIIAAVVALTSQAHAQFFSMRAAHSTAPIHLSPVNANGGGLWVGKPQSDYCPVVEGFSCANTTGLTTTYGVRNDDGRMGLGVSVPGGQQIYINPTCGRIGYTSPHSAYMPPGSITVGWRNDELLWFGQLSWNVTGVGAGVLFCAAGNDSSVGPWQAYAALDNVKYGGGCIGAALITSNATKANGYEYTG